MKSRVIKYIPRWLQNQLVLNDPISKEGSKPCSSIAKRINEMEQKIDFNTAFKTLYRSCQERILRFIKTVRKFKPFLCVQKQSIVKLNLRW